MAGGNAGKINKPARVSSTIVRVDTKRNTFPCHSPSSQHKKAKRKPARPPRRKEEPHETTTREKQRQCRSNPHANVRLSGKKKRQILREAKRLMAEQLVMEGE